MLLYSPAGEYLCYFKFAYLSTQTKQIQSRIYLFEGCYSGTIVGSGKKSKN